jgi:hypothetical protein
MRTEEMYHQGEEGARSSECYQHQTRCGIYLLSEKRITSVNMFFLDADWREGEKT